MPSTGASQEQGRFPQIGHLPGQRMVMITSKQSVTLLKGHSARTDTHTYTDTGTDMDPAHRTQNAAGVACPSYAVTCARQPG